MFKHLLIATDESPASGASCWRRPCRPTQRSSRSTEPWSEGAYAPLPTPALIKAYEKAATGSVTAILDGARKAAEAAAVACRTLHIKDPHAAQGIIKGALDQGCDLIIVGGRTGAAQWAGFSLAAPR